MYVTGTATSAFKMLREADGQNRDFPKIRIYGNEPKTPKQWKKYLAYGESKENLQNYLFEHWTTSANTLIGNVTVIMASVGNTRGQRAKLPLRNIILPLISLGEGQKMPP